MVLAMRYKKFFITYTSRTSLEMGGKLVSYFCRRTILTFLLELGRQYILINNRYRSSSRPITILGSSSPHSPIKRQCVDEGYLLLES
jgi:hypothetical protein